MDNISYDQLLIMQAEIESNRKDSYEKNKNLTEDLTEIIVSTTDQIKIYKSSPENKDSPKDQDTKTVVLDNNKAPPLEGGHSRKMVAYGVSNMISSHQNSMKSSSRQNSKMTHLLTFYHYIKINSYFEE